LCPRWAGGDGESSGFDDCPEGTFGHRINQLGERLEAGFQCVRSAGTFSTVLVLDTMTFGAGAALLRVGFRFSGATLSHALSTSLGGGSRALGQEALETANTLVGSMASTGRSYAVGVPLAGGANLVGGNGFSLNMFVPFSGTTDRVDAVGRDCG
jgi:hypothetical protein